MSHRPLTLPSSTQRICQVTRGESTRPKHQRPAVLSRASPWWLDPAHAGRCCCTCHTWNLKASKVPLEFRIHLNQFEIAWKMPRSASYGTQTVQIRQPWTHAWCCADHFPTKAFCPLSCCWAMLMALLAFTRAMATGQPKVCVVNPQLVFRCF